MDNPADLSLGEYLRRRRRQLGLEAKQVAHRAGFPASYISKLETGARGAKPPLETLRRLAIAYEIEFDELERMARGSRVLRELPAESYEALLERARMVAPVAIPVVEHPAHGGHVGTPVLEYVYVERERAARHDLVCIPVIGDCMSPRIDPGDRVIVARDLWPEQGQTVVAIVEEAVLVRRYYLGNCHIVLRAINPAYRDVEARQADIVGVVLEVRRTP